MRALNPTSPAGMTDCEIILRALLAEGPCASREVLADLAARGFTAKQVRGARERQGIVAVRGGFGQATRTTWRLPSPPPVPTDALGGRQVRKAAVRVQVRTGARELGAELANPCDPWIAQDSTGQQPPADATLAELARLAGRVEVFQRRGSNPAEARDVALRLLASDRENRHALGSCAQCHTWRQGDCQLTPLPVTTIHVCWFRRTETP